MGEEWQLCVLRDILAAALRSQILKMVLGEDRQEEVRAEGQLWVQEAVCGTRAGQGRGQPARVVPRCGGRGCLPSAAVRLSRGPGDLSLCRRQQWLGVC